MFGLDNHDFVLTALSQGDMDVKAGFAKSGRRRHRLRVPPPDMSIPGRMSVGQGSLQQPDILFLRQRMQELRQRERMHETRQRMLDMLNAGKRKR